jgi:type I restriction enzyme S subunit
VVIDAHHLAIVERILAAHVRDVEVWAFGSRVHARPKPFSDLDLVLVGEQPLDVDRLVRLSLAFEESDLPFRVDLVDWSASSPTFRATIEREHEVIQRAHA